MLKIKQFVFPQDFDTGTQNEYFTQHGSLSDPTDATSPLVGPNLTNNAYIYQITIYSLPGNKFVLDSATARNIIIINNTGKFSMDFGEYPMTGISLWSENNFDLSQTLIDVVYQDIFALEGEDD